MKPRSISNKYVHFLRAFVPSWKFFEDIGPVPQLFFRIKTGPDQFGPWQNSIGPWSRHWWHFFINPKTNELLAAQSLFQHAATAAQEALERGEPESLAANTAYQLLQGWARRCAKEAYPSLALPAQFQFKLCAMDPLNPDISFGDILISPDSEIL